MLISSSVALLIIGAIILSHISESDNQYIDLIYSWRCFMVIVVLLYFWLLILSQMLGLVWDQEVSGTFQKNIKYFIVVINFIPFFMLMFYRFVVRKRTENHPLRLRKVLITTLPIIFISFLLSTLAIGGIQKAWKPNVLQKAGQFIGVYKDTLPLKSFDAWLQLVGIKTIVPRPKLEIDPVGSVLVAATFTPLGPFARIASVLRLSSKTKFLRGLRIAKTKVNKLIAHPSIISKKLKDLPKEAEETCNKIRNGGPYQYPKKDGSIFKNRESKLPHQEPGYYKEFTVRTPESPDRGTRRIVQGKNGELYYTDDHYNTFSLIEVD